MKAWHQQKIDRFTRMGKVEAFNRLVVKYLTYEEPEKYRAKIPGYAKNLFLLRESKKLVKKIIRLKRQSEDGVSTATGISSLLFRTPSQTAQSKQTTTTFSAQRQSVQRLFRGSLDLEVIPDQGTFYEHSSEHGDQLVTSPSQK